MNQQTRTTASAKNFVFSSLSHFVTFFLSFVSRTVFIHTLGAEYLGLGGLFSNILSILSLTELGLAAAVTQTLYRPLAMQDIPAITRIMTFFTKAYRVIGLVIAGLGFAFTPFLKVFVKELPDIPHIYTIYILYVVHHALSYYFTPKRTLVICDQRMYVLSIFRTVFYILVTFAQIAALVVTGDYVVYLLVRMLFLLLESIAVECYAKKLYPFLKHKCKADKQYRKSVFRNVRALMYHKIGGVFSSSTDSILISSMLGLAYMGKYSNYALITGAIGAIMGLTMNAVSASVGNLGATSDGKKSESVFRTVFFANFWLCTLCGTNLLVLVNPILKLWLGQEMVFPMFDVVIIAACFYVSNIRDPVQIFSNAYGLFYEERKKPILSALVNLVFSLLLVKPLGIGGVFLGTLISMLAVDIWYEPHILYRYGFRLPARGLALTYLSYTAISAFCMTLSFRLCIHLPQDSIFGIAACAVVCFAVTTGVILILFSPTKQFQNLSRSMLRLVRSNKAAEAIAAVNLKDIML